MALGTSDGKYFEDEWSYVTESFNPKTAQKPQQSLDSLFEEQASTSNKMPLGAPGEVTDAFKSDLGTQVAGSFDTLLTPEEELKFQSWKMQHAPNDSGQDYDLRGAFVRGITPAENGHWPDTFKKPNHPTFSDQSIYAPYGNPGRWEGETFIEPLKRSFTPTEETNIKKKVEPEASPISPEVPNQFIRALGMLLGKKVKEGESKNTMDILFKNKTEDTARYQLWPERLVKSLFESAKSGVTLPKDVLEGKVDLTSEEGIKRSLDLAPFAILGTKALEAAAGKALSAAERVTLENYAGSGYELINKTLANPEAAKLTEKLMVKPQVKLLDRMISNSQPLEIEHTVFRGIAGRSAHENLSKYFGMREGDLLTFPAFTSTSTQRGVASIFTDNEGIMFKINVPKGARVLNVDKTRGYKAEHELILPRNSIFRVLDPIGFSNKMHLELVL